MIAKKGTLTSKAKKTTTAKKPKAAKVTEERDEAERDEDQLGEAQLDEAQETSETAIDVDADEADEADEMVAKAVKKPSPPSKASSAPKLPGASLRYLRGLGHELAPVVMVGKDGITPSLVRATNAALLTHELIKVKVQGEAPIDRRDAAAALADESDAVLAQVLGRTFLLYKRNPKKPKIKFPRA